MTVGAVSGSVAPGVGNLIGMVVGVGVGFGFYLATEVFEYKDASFTEWVDNIF